MSEDQTTTITDLLDQWIDKLSEGRLLMGNRDAMRSQFQSWLQLLESKLGGDTTSEHELQRLVALHARGLGVESRPASAAVTQILTLADLVAKSSMSGRAEALLAIRELTRVAADAHALGQQERLKAQHEDQIRSFSPLIRLEPKTVLAFFLGPMSPKIIDSLFGRVLRECVVNRPQTVVIDLLGAAPDDDRFHQTVTAFLEAEGADQVELILTGVRDVERTTQSLESAGAEMSRIRLSSQLDDFLGSRSLDRP